MKFKQAKRINLCDVEFGRPPDEEIGVGLSLPERLGQAGIPSPRPEEKSGVWAFHCYP